MHRCPCPGLKQWCIALVEFIVRIYLLCLLNLLPRLEILAVNNILLISFLSAFSKSPVSFLCYRFSCVQLFATLWTIACQTLSVGLILQTRILGWVAIFYSKGPSQPREPNCVSQQAGSLPLGPPGKFIFQFKAKLKTYFCKLSNELSEENP